jgi:hypothetical protein
MLNLTDCPACGLELQVPSTLLGERVKCPNCAKHFVAPQSVTEIRPVPVPPPAVPARLRHTYFCCPFCDSTERPLVRSRVAVGGWIIFFSLLVFFPFCFLGLLVRDEYHVCRSCGIKLD